VKRIFKSKGKNKSLALFLVLVFVFELTVQFLPVIRAYAIDYSAVANNYYEMGFDSYNGITRDDVLRDVLPQGTKKYIDKPGYGTFYLNTEYAIDYRTAVYGLPGNVPGNPYGATKVSYSANPWKPSSIGYWWIKEYEPNIATIVPANTSGATRVIFKYDGYSADGQLYQNPYWSENGDEFLKWSDLTAANLASKTDSDVRNQYNSLVAQDRTSSLGSGERDKIYNTYVKGGYYLSTVSSNKDIDGSYINALSWLTEDLLFSKGVIIGSAQEGYLQIILFFRKNGKVAPVKFTGAINKFLPDQQDVVAYSISYGSPNLPKTSDGSAFVFDPTKNPTANINLTVKGVFYDYKDCNHSIVDAWYFTRNDARYYTVLNYFKINGTDYTDQLVYKGVTGENKYREGQQAPGTDNSKVVFTSNDNDYNIQIPDNLLQTGTNTITISAKVRVFFTAGYHVDSYNSASQTITIIKKPSLSVPTLQLSVVPAQSEVTVTTDNSGNLIYTPSSITHTVKPVKVSNMTVPAGFKVKRLEFVIDRDNTRVASATTPDYSESYDTTATTITSFSQSKSFNYNTTYIQAGKTGTPAYYGKVRYVIADSSGKEYTSGWSTIAPVQATVTLNIPDDTPRLAASSGDKINLDSSGNPKNYTVKINATAEIRETGAKKIQKWVFTAVHKQKTSESATQTVTTTSKTANATLSVNIATSSSRTSEDFDVTATLYFTDNTSKKSNTVTVSVPVSTSGSGINLELSADKPLLSGKPGDVVSVTVTATSTVTVTGQITDHRVWVRADYEQLSSPTKSGTQSTITASRTFSYVLNEDMNGKDLVFVARSRATVGSQQLDSGQKTVKVRVVVTDEPIPENQSVPEDQPILPVEEPQNNPPAVLLQAIPSVVAQGDDAMLVATASDQDEGDEATVTSITANGGNVEGFVSNKNQASAVFWSDEIGTYTAEAVAQDTKGAQGKAQANITVIPAIPRPVCYITGTLKENRKVILDATSSYAGSKRAYILWSEAQWTITPADNSIPANAIKVVESLKGSQKLNCLFKLAGTYKVTLTLKNNYGNSATGTWYLTIKPDEKPVVSFTTPTKILRDPADNSQASIQITSNSYSPDNDVIVKHVWFYAWDSNNDGNFDNETWYVRKSDGTWQAVGDYNKVIGFDLENFDSGNDSTITFKVTNVGKYKVELWVREEFGQETIEQFVTPYDRRRNISTSMDDDKKVVEVLNVAPFATLNSSKIEKKKILINVVTDYSDVNPLKSALNQLKADLYSYGVDVNYTIDNSKEVIGSYTTTTTTTVAIPNDYTVTKSSTSPNFPDTITEQAPNGQYITMYKYGSPTSVTDKQYTGNFGYYGTLYYNRVTYQRWWSDGPYPPSVSQYELQYFQSGTWGNYDVYTVDWYEYVNVTTYYQQYKGTYYTYTTTTTTVTNNFEGLTINVVKQLTENIADKYLIFVSNGTGDNFSSGWGNYYSFSGLSKEHLRYVILNNYAVYATVPSSAWDYKLPESTKQQYTIRQFVNYAPAGGKLYDVNQFTTILNNDIKPKYTNPQITPDPVYVLADEEKVIYYPYWEDYENDAIINQRWKYEHDETVFDNSLGKAEFDSIWLNAPIEVFTKPGKYTITFQVQDNPPPGTSDFDEYKLWSKLERQMILYVHRRPVADFTVKLSGGKPVITDNSYDPDHQYNRSDKGIIAWKWQYKTLDDSTWTDTTLSNLQNMTLQSGKIYLIKLEVQDCDGPNGVGVWSKPKIAMIDLTTSNNPPVADFVVDSEILKGNQPNNLQDKSYDPDNDAITIWHWWIYKASDNSLVKDFGETANNNISNVKSYIATLAEDSYKLSLQVKDSAGNYSTITTKQFKVYSQSKDTEPDVVNNPPTGTFTMTITDHKTKLRPTTTYSDPDGDPKNAEQWYIKFNGQTQYFDKLPDTLESAGYTYDGTYEIGYRVQDNPTSRSTKLKPLWSNWYVQTYYVSTSINIQVWTEKIAKRARNYTEALATGLATVKTSDFKIGEVVVVKAKTTGYVEKIDVWFDRVTTTTPKQGKVTKQILGYWQCSIKDGTMTLTDIKTNLLPAQEVAQRDLSYESMIGKKPLKFTPLSAVPYSMDWSSDPFDLKLQLQFVRSNNNSYVKSKFPDRYRDLWDGLYKWDDWQGNNFSYAKAMELYGRPPYFQKGDLLFICVRAYKRNIDGSYTTKVVDVPINITGSIELATGEK